ncbi:hypothetical protein N0V84_002372 [Fusarium piperis]|uniref:Uncharacterized protein n=1 Tax=Fusarium piperis TaxID=1435070 RepID=A0A9W9BRS6_9HYPO|nr:hypothetical protein N0V84_002372 [Fusarium piperis]
MALDDLAPELLLLILCQIDTPKDLYSFISASPSCYRLFAGSQEHVISSVLRNAFTSENIHHAVAALSLPAAHERARPSNAEITSALDGYFDGDTLDLPEDKTSLVALCRLYHRVNQYTTDYFQNSLYILGYVPRRSADFYPSIRERTRFYRGFLRLELFCRAFYDRTYPDELGPGNSKQAQFDDFFCRLEPWEVEEISCALYYLIFVVEGVVDAVEHHLYQALLTNPATHIMPPGEGPPKELTNTDIPDGRYLIRCGSVDREGLELFSERGKYLAPERIISLAALGLGFVHHLVNSDNDKRYLIVQRRAKCGFFLPDTLDSAPSTDSEIKTPDKFNNIRVDRPNLGWFWFKAREQHIYSGWHPTYDNWRLRERAFVFWDPRRIRNLKGLYAQFPNARKGRVDGVYARWSKESLEERIVVDEILHRSGEVPLDEDY